MSEVIKNRYEFVVLFDVENGNPNGDPDAGNMPRTDSETGHGFITDVCLKRKIRNYVEDVKGDETGYKIYIKPGKILNDKHKEAYEATGLKANKSTEADAMKYMCDNYFDVRTFGAVMTTGDYNCGQVRGAVQINFAKSINPVNNTEITITRQAVTGEKDANKANMMGKKSFVPYGLYKTEGYISANLAEKTGFNEDDLNLLFNAVENMFENDHSAARGKMSVRKFIIFKHESKLGNAPSSKLFDLINVKLKDETKPPRTFGDYEVTIDKDNLPQNVEMIEKV